jgi:hypothetical protein
MFLFQCILGYLAECFSLQYTESNADADHLSSKSHFVSTASMSKQLNEENVLDILNESDMCLISDNSDDSDDCANDIAVADEENSEVEEGQGHFLGNTDYNSGFIWEDMDNYHGHELFSGHSGPQNSAINAQDIMSVFLLFFSRHNS